jgi:serine/threonine protein kinase
MLLGKYRVVRVIGAGGMGAILEAENVRTTRRVAIKVLHGDSNRVSNAVRRFQNEARASAQLEHPNSIDVLDLEQDEGGTLFIVQELLHGETLYDRFQREGRLPWREAFDLMLPIMSALASAHRRGIIHRDVKPENIFLAQAAPNICVPKIIDFGVARVFFDASERLTRTDRVVGTPFYMSPEQAAGERELNGQTDVWAVGVVLYEILSGDAPFEGTDPRTLLFKVSTGRHTHLRDAAPDLPDDVVETVERALIPDRAGRYQTMDQFFDAALACRGVSTVSVGHLFSLAPPAPTERREPAPAPATVAPESVAPAVLLSSAKPSESSVDSLAPTSRPNRHVDSRSGFALIGGIAVVAALVIGFAGGASLHQREDVAPTRVRVHAAVATVACPPAAPTVAPPVEPAPPAPTLAQPEAVTTPPVEAPATPIARPRHHRRSRGSRSDRGTAAPRE